MFIAAVVDNQVEDDPQRPLVTPIDDGIHIRDVAVWGVYVLIVFDIIPEGQKSDQFRRYIGWITEHAPQVELGTAKRRG